MPLFENQTPELIRSRILERIGTKMQTREGSFTYDVVSSVSFELWRVMMTIDELVDAFYVDEYSGKYLDEHAALFGLTRREGSYATAAISFAGAAGTIVPEGTSFFTQSGLEFTLDDTVVLVDGSGTGNLTAAQPGASYNVDAGEINQVLKSIVGLESCQSTAAAGGSDPESDAALYSRIVPRRQNTATSGNEAHYKEWALECDGVGAAKVTGLWAGPGTVRVIIAGYDFTPVDDEIVGACAAHIETQRPVGPEVTVVSIGGTAISITATVAVDATTTADDVQAAFVSELGTYIESIATGYFQTDSIEPYNLYYNKIASLLMSVPGVVDFSDLTVNGGTGNIVIEGTQVPVLGEVSIT